eukprot:sb/3467391/
MDPELPPSNNTTTSRVSLPDYNVGREATPSTRTRSNAMRMSLTPSLAPSEIGDRIEVAGDVVEATYQPSRSQFTFGTDNHFHLFVMKLTHTKFFHRLMLIIILINAIVICIQLETDPNKRDLHKAFTILNDIFLAAYTLEFLLKLYSDRTSYWFSVYNLFDFGILVVAFVDLALEYISARYIDGIEMRFLRSILQKKTRVTDSSLFSAYSSPSVFQHPVLASGVRGSAEIITLFNAAFSERVRGTIARRGLAHQTSNPWPFTPRVRGLVSEPVARDCSPNTLREESIIKVKTVSWIEK